MPNTTPVFDFGALMSDSNARLTLPVTIYRGIHPQPLKSIRLKDLLLEMASEDIEKIAESIALKDVYQKYLFDASQGVKDAKKPYEDRKTQLKGFSIGEFSYRNGELPLP